MARPEESNQRMRDEAKRKILSAATRVFARKGLAATRMSDIATEAEVGYGLIYHYFKSKEEIYQAIIERSITGLARIYAYVSSLDVTPWERITIYTDEVMSGMQREPDMTLLGAQIVTSEVASSEIRNKVITNSKQNLLDFQQLVEAGQTAGQVAAGDPIELTSIFFAIIGGLGLQLISSGFQETRFPRVETVLRLLKA